MLIQSRRMVSYLCTAFMCVALTLTALVLVFPPAAIGMPKEEWALIESHYWWYCDPDRTQECYGIMDGMTQEMCERVVRNILADGNPHGSQFYCAKHMNGNKFRERMAKAQREKKTMGQVLAEEGVDIDAGRPADFKGECH